MSAQHENFCLLTERTKRSQNELLEENLIYSEVRKENRIFKFVTQNSKSILMHKYDAR